jgi:hypothetical protein
MAFSNRLKLAFGSCIFVLALLVMSVDIFAQEVTPTATPTVSAVPTPVPVQLNVMPLCPQNDYCWNGAQCARNNDDDHGGHTIKITPGSISQADNSNLFFEECITVPGIGEVCVPLPLATLTDAPTSAVLQDTVVSWTENKELFINAIIQRCRAGFATGEALRDSMCNRAVILENDGYKNVDAVLEAEDYRFVGLFTSSESGESVQMLSQPWSIPVGGLEWESFTAEARQRRIQVVKYFGFGGDSEEGVESAPHVSQLGMPNYTNECGGAIFDPYGKVFDTVSLRPVQDAKVWIFAKDIDLSGNPIYTKYKTNDLAFANPSRTSMDGGFTFRVPDGDYKLFVTNSLTDLNASVFTTPASYQLSTAADPSSNGKDVKIEHDSKTVVLYTDVYASKSSDKAPTLTQSGSPIHKNISVRDLSPAEAQIYLSKIVVDPLGNYVISGKTNMPFVTVEIWGSDGKIITSQVSDVSSLFKFDIKLRNVPAGVTVSEIRVIDPEYTRMEASISHPAIFGPISRLFDDVIDHIVKPAYAKQIIEIPKRLTHLEGYAYDEQGRVLPGARVLITENIRFTTFFTTTADENGFFVVRSADLPPSDYQITYIPANSNRTVKVTVSKFESDNKQYVTDTLADFTRSDLSSRAQNHVAENSTLYPDKVNVTSSPATKDTQMSPPDDAKNDRSIDDVTDDRSRQMANTSLIVYIVILLLLVVGVGLLVVYYLKRKQEPHLYDDTI